MTFEAPRGTHDILPSEQPRWRHVLGEFERLCHLYGYRRIDTPVFEETDLFARTSGQGSDVVTKEMYTFEDRGDRSLTLRAEATAPIVRAYLEHGLHREPQPQKLYTHETIYRYGRPQKGRFREHWQLDVEAIGSEDPALDAEVIQLYDSLLGRLGVTEYRLELNSIGDADCRPAYLDRLRPWLEEHAGELDEATREQASRNPLRALDNIAAKPPAVQEVLRQAPTIGDSLCDACREHFAEVRRYLDAYGVRYEVVPTLVRGLDYYTRTTWEFVGPEGGSQSTSERRRPLRRPGGGARRGAHARRRVRRGDRAASSRPRGCRSRAAGRGGRRRLLHLRGGRGPDCGPRQGRRAARGRHARRGRLRGPLRQGPANAGEPPRRGARRRRRRGHRSLRGDRVTWRDLMCGEVRPEHVGQRLTLAGWADSRRDHGGLVFVDLRDRTGICQLVLNPERAPEAAKTGHAIRNEFVLRAEGEVVRRAPEAVNPNIPTGEVELQVDTLEIVSTSTPLPFQLDEENVDETLRLRHRWLDLRRPKMQRNIGLRSTMVSAIRRTMESGGFLEIETPILFKPTPEGARDFIVPSRLQPGRFFALPQSPQILKQLLVIGGFDRYFQIARCFRDEDLRADRVQEITQLDVEMAFPDQEFLFALMERMIQTAWRDCLGVELEAPFPRLTWAEADARFGSDKPDLRFGLELEDATEITRDSQFGVFARRAVRALYPRPAGLLARRARASRGGRQGVGRQGARVPRVGRGGRGPLADRQVPL